MRRISEKSAVKAFDTYVRYSLQYVADNAEFEDEEGREALLAASRKIQTSVEEFRELQPLMANMIIGGVNGEDLYRMTNTELLPGIEEIYG